MPNPLPLRELLICEVLSPMDRKLLYIFVLRKGLKFQLLDALNTDSCALVRDPKTLNLLKERFKLPVRLLDGPESAFLSLQVLQAHDEGRDFYQLTTQNTRHPPDLEGN